MSEMNIPDSGLNESKKNNCKRCRTLCDPYEKPALQCKGPCQQKIHVQCLKRGGVPSAFVGDMFFKLTCSDCNTSNNEVLLRDITWPKAIILTLYNLKEKSSGISKRGYFHWKSDISTFVDRNWDSLLGKNLKQKKNWIGTISGTLSHNTGIYFKSGLAELGEPGWWKLVNNDPPEVLFNQRNKVDRKKIEEMESNSSGKQCTSPSISESSISLGEDSNSALDSFKIQGISAHAQASDHPNEILSDFLLTEEDLHDMDMLDTEDGIEMDNGRETLCLADIIRNFQDQYYQSDQYNCFESMDYFTSKEPENIQKISEEDDFVICDNIKNILVDNQFVEDSDSFNYAQELVPSPSLFTASKSREWPWERLYNGGEKRPRINEREEAYLLQRIKKQNLDSAPPSVRRLYRKLCVRKLKREYNSRILDIDKFGIKSHVSQRIHKKGNRVLDRFISDFQSGVYEQRLQGHSEPISAHSPYTHRLLKPFIRRDTSSEPIWLKLMNELCAKVNRNNPKWKPPPRAPIDYSYIRPQHIPAVNSLCNQFFWPGIDLTECLQYPDFTCVVLYKKLVIGFAVLVPDVGYNQAYISFFLTRPEWRRCGIGTFMLYHLIQTCMGKDVTLHVSVTNPALILYQKFGFKVEEFIQDFYDKYMSPDSRECKHALFLRLSR